MKPEQYVNVEIAMNEAFSAILDDHATYKESRERIKAAFLLGVQYSTGLCNCGFKEQALLNIINAHNSHPNPIHWMVKEAIDKARSTIR